MTPLFVRALGEAAFARLPAPLRALHGATGPRQARGEAAVEGPEGMIAALVARLVGFPPAGSRIPVRVAMDPLPDGGERWTRWFGDRRFASRLSPSAPGRVWERFGPFSFDLALPADERGLGLRIQGWRIGPLPLPRALAPVSPAREDLDEQGRFRFDVEIRLPLGLGRVVRYRGWLVAAEHGPPPPCSTG